MAHNLRLKIIKTIFVLLLALNAQACSGTSSDATIQLLQNSRNNMVFVEGGTFTMGQVFLNGKPVQMPNPYKITLPDYYISKDNVSYGEYDIYTQATGQGQIDPVLKEHNFFARGSNYPVPDATWYQAHDYCAWLAKQTGLPYALPTEAQWEFTARNRGNSNWAFPTNNGKQELGINFPNYQQLSTQNPDQEQGMQYPLPVGSMPCTPMGVCGMSGTVNQWVNDYYSAYGYRANSGSEKVLRGSSAGEDPSVANTFARQGDDPSDANGGFRCVINSSTPSAQLGAFASGYPK